MPGGSRIFSSAITILSPGKAASFSGAKTSQPGEYYIIGGQTSWWGTVSGAPHTSTP